MITLLPHLKWLHVGLALASGGWFALRGAAVLAGMRWPQAAGVRRLSMLIDTALLAAALALVTILPPAVFANGWLVVKLGLLVAYIVAGTYALRRARSRAARAACYLIALALFGAIVGVARAHHPLGPLAGLIG